MDALTTTVHRDLDADVTLVRAIGSLSMFTAQIVRAALLRARAECPSAIVADVSSCAAETPAALAVFPAVARHVESHPWVALLLCGADDDFLRNGGKAALGDVPVFRTRSDALDAAADALRTQRRFQIHARHSNAAPREVREAVGQICDEWGLDQVRAAALLIVSELVTNAVRHARTDIDVDAVLRDSFLHIRVHDGSVAPPQRDETPLRLGLRDSGRGLPIVAHHSSSWGFVINPTGSGKMVWATLRTLPVRSPRLV
jgi:anti-sigma regulatory factor (Ser/Thr protein kinase)